MGEPAGAANAPVPSPRRIDTLFDELFTTAKSGFASRLKSALMTWVGAPSAAYGEPAGWVKNAASAGPATKSIITTDASATGRARLMKRHYAWRSGGDRR